jgi:hypothetical protein
MQNQNARSLQIDNTDTAENLHLRAFLDDKVAERDRVIMQLRQLDRLLIQFGRLKQETLPRRVR